MNGRFLCYKDLQNTPAIATTEPISLPLVVTTTGSYSPPQKLKRHREKYKVPATDLLHTIGCALTSSRPLLTNDHSENYKD